jgi:hypothetical protein
VTEVPDGPVPTLGEAIFSSIESAVLTARINGQTSVTLHIRDVQWMLQHVKHNLQRSLNECGRYSNKNQR